MLAKISIFPTDKGESVSAYVVKVIEYIIKEAERTGIKYDVTSMGTIIEGEFDDIWKLLKECHNIMRRDSNRVYITIEIDDRKGKSNALTYKKEKINEMLKNKN